MCGTQGWADASKGMLRVEILQERLQGQDRECCTQTPSVQLFRGPGCAQLTTAPTPSLPQHSQLLCPETPKNCPKLQLFRFQHFCCIFVAGQVPFICFPSVPVAAAQIPSCSSSRTLEGAIHSESLGRTPELQFQGFLARRGGGRGAAGENTSANALRCSPCAFPAGSEGCGIPEQRERLLPSRAGLAPRSCPAPGAVQPSPAFPRFAMDRIPRPAQLSAEGMTQPSGSRIYSSLGASVVPFQKNQSIEPIRASAESAAEC